MCVVFLGPVLSKGDTCAYVLSQAFAQLWLGSMLTSFDRVRMGCAWAGAPNGADHHFRQLIKLLLASGPN